MDTPISTGSAPVKRNAGEAAPEVTRALARHAATLHTKRCRPRSSR